MHTDTAMPWRGAADLPDDDVALVRAAQQDRAAFAPLYHRYRHRVYAYLYTRLPHAEDAADLTQQVFVQALAALPRYRLDGPPFAGWLFRIARNAAVDHQRRRCHTTTQAFATAVQAGGRSMLAICQETAPGMTAQQLVTVLVASFKPSLDAQVASGALTPAQEAAAAATGLACARSVVRTAESLRL